MTVVIKNCAYILAHVPGFIRYGSKPYRDIQENGGPGGDLETRIYAAARTFEEVVAYPPNQVYIGNLYPDDLNKIQQPWFRNPFEGASQYGKFGRIFPEEVLYGWLKGADDFNLVWLTPEFTNRVLDRMLEDPFFDEEKISKLKEGISTAKIEEAVLKEAALPLYFSNSVVGCVRRDHDKDDALKAHVLLENLLAKATGALAMNQLFRTAEIAPEDIEFILSCSEEAVGDRYNRGGGSLSKAIGEMCNCTNATGHDIKAFCAAPIHAIMNAACQVKAGVFERVAIVGGGCLSKIGMKYAGHLKNGSPLLEDVLAGIAILVTRDDGISPRVRLDCIGKHDIGSNSSQESIMNSLVGSPLDKSGLKMTDIDKYSTELHNPEITLPAGSGNTPLTNYRIMGALAAIRGEIQRNEIDDFVQAHGMPGYSPTQGHIPAAVPFLGHAIDATKKGELQRTMFVAKGSLFLGRMSQLSDGLSFLMEKNPQQIAKKI